MFPTVQAAAWLGEQTNATFVTQWRLTSILQGHFLAFIIIIIIITLNW